MAHSSVEDFDFTKEEIKGLRKAFEKEEFRNLLNEYFEEVNDPENRAAYEKEYIQFERERGVEAIFIHPEPGYVLKSSVDGSRKVFINICSNNNVEKPSSTLKFHDGSRGLQWTIPYMHGKFREDLDKKSKFCNVYDIIFHPDTLHLASKNGSIKELVNDIAVTAVEDNHKVKIDKKNIVFPKLQYKGGKIPTVVRKALNKNNQEKESEHTKLEDIIPEFKFAYPLPPPEDSAPKKITPRSNAEFGENDYTTPKHIVKHRKEIDLQECICTPDAKFHTVIPLELVIEIDLPLAKTAANVNLDVFDKTLKMICEKPARYKLNLNLPYAVDDEKGSAKFDKKNKKLIVVLPVKRSIYKQPEFFREDSGIESDPNQNNCSSSEEDIRKKVHLLREEEPIGEREVIQSTTSKEEIKHLTKISSTNEEIKDSFLRSDIHYSYPSNSINIENGSLVVTVDVKNVDPQSIVHQFLSESEGVHIKFSSLGSGFFPIHYSLCFKIPGFILDATTLKIDVWDRNIIAAVKTNQNYGNKIISYLIGTSEETMQEKNLSPTSSAFFNLDSNKQKNNESEKEDREEEEGKASSLTSSPLHEKPLDKNICKSRTFSESCELPEAFASGHRSILKGSRSLSESHTDDYNTWSSLDSESHEDLAASKKTVRFSDIVSKKIFRANSSILGQRKKNERKSRNRKKAATERLLSAGSEESETDREEFDSVSELSDVSSDDSSGNSSTGTATIVPSSKKHRRRGAKSQRKAAATAKHSHFTE